MHSYRESKGDNTEELETVVSGDTPDVSLIRRNGRIRKRQLPPITQKGNPKPPA